MTIIKCDVCGADSYNNNEMKKGKVIFEKQKKLMYIDLCPNCYKNGTVFYVRQEKRGVENEQ